MADSASIPVTGAGRRPRIGEVLRSRGLISDEQLALALRAQSESFERKQLGQILVESGAITAEDMTRALAESLGIEFATLTVDSVEPGVAECLPADLLERHNALPLSASPNSLRIAVEQFTDLFVIDELAHRCGRSIEVVAAVGDNIRQARHAILKSRAPTTGELPASVVLDEILDEISVDDLTVIEEAIEDESDLESESTHSPIIKLVNYAIQGAVALGASDIHIEPDEVGFRIRYRVDGELVERLRPPQRMLPAVVSRIKIMAGLDISERRLPQDGVMTVKLSDRAIDLRVSTMNSKYGEVVVMRVADRSASIKRLEVLGLDADDLGRFRKVIGESHGIVLVTGPTGSGKTTTLYAALADIASIKQNVSTVEDPVERRLRGVNQFQINPAAGFTFGKALRSLLRQDPDIIMVGEIRDAETAKLATEAALTGHLVLSTLHTNDALTAIPRLVNMGVESYLVAATLRAVLAQRLVRRVCLHCRAVRAVTPEQSVLLARIIDDPALIEAAYVGQGCPRCHGTGYHGRIGVFELLAFKERVLARLLVDAGPNSLADWRQTVGCKSMLQDALQKVARGFISLDGVVELLSRADLTVEKSSALTKSDRRLRSAA